ncbi:hypothetical protein SmJEL517_g02764 [Synchytrium microbalum]|uniref:DNA repair protein RAD5 n=1 Tax=Synchytrium microbalum TaxID=1806994 RepID=A0A507C9L2_9FUNG|nr:uncharacterized protein SmJEL517_g02764 [Synchytrium microbalum]TPX34676.1 hypothetical protein SmJEL517_g02764 [Synchytrium microbalum]
MVSDPLDEDYTPEPDTKMSKRARIILDEDDIDRVSDSDDTSSVNVPDEPIDVDAISAISTLREFCGVDAKSDTVLNELLRKYDGDIQRCAAAFFDLPVSGRTGAASTLERCSKRVKLDCVEPDVSMVVDVNELDLIEFPVFIGEIVIPVLSTVKSYPNTIVSFADVVEFERPKPALTLPKTSTKKLGKSSTNSSSGGGSSSAGRPTTVKAQNTIVRVNKIERPGVRREVGKIASDQSWASNITKLLDNGLATFTASIVDVPNKLETFTQFYVSARVSLTRRAFETATLGDTEEDEKRVKDRKIALTWVFAQIGLVPAADVPSENDDATSTAIKDEDLRAEVTVNDLTNIYKQAQKYDRPQSECEPADGFQVELRPYQKEALAVMMEMEADGKDQKGTSPLSPLWRRFVFPGTDQVFYMNPYTGELSIKFVPMERTRGGILADEQGLGKTIETLALIHTNPKLPSLKSSSGSTAGSSSSLGRSVKEIRSTLIVCPLSVLAQWRQEALKCLRTDPSVPASSIVEEYYGSNRTLNDKKMFRRGDKGPPVVITTYGVVGSEFEKEGSPLFSTTWYRIVLDEAHFIKEQNTRQSKACCGLLAERRWALTGTPIQNKLEDLYSLINFLKLPPWDNFSFWRSFISLPFEKKDVRALEVVTAILQPIFLRRTKDQKSADGSSIVKLPPKNIEVVYLDFSKDEQIIYDSLLKDSKRRLNDGNGRYTYAHVFEMILRLRQMCDHPFLVAAFAKTTLETIGMEDLVLQYCQTGTESTAYMESVMKELQQQAIVDTECVICMDTIVAATIIPSCLHTACRDCLFDYMERCEAQGKPTECPTCRKPCSEKELLSVLRKTTKAITMPGSSKHANNSNSDDDLEDDDDDEKTSTQKPKLQQTTVKLSFAKGVAFRPSAKIKALVSFLRATPKDDTPPIKTIVFSLFTSMLDLVEQTLDEQGIEWCRIDGSVSQKKREQVLQRFQNDGKDAPTVMLASLRAMGVGVNLTVASQVVLLDPWWNRAVEDQAMDRVHRFGQIRNVEVRRFIVRGTLEEKILAIQERKSNIAGAVTAGEDTRMTLEDLKALFD